MKPRVLFYVQHLLGIGHVVRALRIARALLADDFTVKLVMGGVPVAGIDLGDFDSVQLPPVRSGADGFTDLVDDAGRPATDAYWADRKRRLLACFRSFSPDIILIEAYPFGRRQMRFELLPLLELAKTASPRPLVATSVRDILQENRKPKRLTETLAVVNRHFDLVLVHGDPQYTRLSDTFPRAGEITADIAYTGIVAGRSPPPPSRTYDVIVSAGGGAVGEAVLSASIDARPLTALADARWLLITGPNLPEPAFDALLARASSGLRVERFRGDFDALLGGARVSISQCGYNTIADILRARCASVVVPFAAGGETEQTRRAAALAARGRLVLVREEELSPETLARAVDDAVSRVSASGDLDIELDGAAATASVLRQALAARA